MQYFGRMQSRTVWFYWSVTDLLIYTLSHSLLTRQADVRNHANFYNQFEITFILLLNIYFLLPSESYVWDVSC